MAASTDLTKWVKPDIPLLRALSHPAASGHGDEKVAAAAAGKKDAQGVPKVTHYVPVAVSTHAIKPPGRGEVNERGVTGSKRTA
ncbi:hypothetical protein CLCR_03200 [Cladophialophora carrionii]|uniref:Uncharacterized protein n=1 Tax=Cladophialophora carrionii TaxID=86049 RepID=A0A1C1D2P9_9EURO|nr:hypothetical protein CLCR_03200 [Cladophialophora carrionii]